LSWEAVGGSSSEIKICEDLKANTRRHLVRVALVRYRRERRVASARMEFTEGAWTTLATPNRRNGWRDGPSETRVTIGILGSFAGASVFLAHQSPKCTEPSIRWLALVATVERFQQPTGNRPINRQIGLFNKTRYHLLFRVKDE
jgi:hypothetical protein